MKPLFSSWSNKEGEMGSFYLGDRSIRGVSPRRGRKRGAIEKEGDSGACLGLGKAGDLATMKVWCYSSPSADEGDFSFLSTVQPGLWSEILGSGSAYGCVAGALPASS